MRSICVVLFVFCSVHVVFSKTQNEEDKVFSKIYTIRKNVEQKELTQKDVDWLYQTALKNMDASSCVPEAIVKTLVLAKKKKEPLKIAQLRLLSLCQNRQSTDSKEENILFCLTILQRIPDCSSFDILMILKNRKGMEEINSYIDWSVIKIGEKLEVPDLYKSMVNHSKKRWANDVKNNPMQAQKRIIKSSVGFDLLEDDVFYKSFLGAPVFKEPELMRIVFVFNSKKDICTNATVVCSAMGKEEYRGTFSFTNGIYVLNPPKKMILKIVASTNDEIGEGIIHPNDSTQIIYLKKKTDPSKLKKKVE